ncbi:histone lysine demethylase PHF8 isoform X2 [Dermacentor silvarum]|uniref:histone lysine demethylase PHF8 isoform X2 n=1 Tax=Dermacentor silvarum TaxID=543639 RepID=UPI002100A1C6|nr:histone lysine demethylase PHF8 isoform X2 [Dermacentor silvarum]
MASVDVYCVCGQPYDPNLFMIQCDVCKDWFHGNCIDVKEHDACDIIKYHCPQCQLTFGPSIWKQRTNWHRHDYSDPDASDKPVQTGTYVFIKELKSRHFESAESIVTRLNGDQFNLQYLLHSGFTNPVLVTKKDGLGLVMPPEDLTVSDVMDFIGPDFMLDVIDVRKQEDLKMTMSEWVDYFNSYDRSKVFNVISLEFSDTRLSDFVKPPSLVQRISWVENCWPSHVPNIGVFQRPAVMKYCLMSTENSFTDFHIDFGGSSVWYHVLRGEKIFYLIRPTQTNLSLYEHWMASANQSETFFGDQADACYRLTLTAGQTLFIPTGWIHSVYTSVDSMVFGGNFLHSFNIGLQLQVYDLEKRIDAPNKYKFPSFETTHWFAASYVIEQLRSAIASEFKPPSFLIVGAKALMTALKNWTQEPNCKLEAIPSGINVPKLLKDMAKEVRTAEKLNGKVKAEKETKKGKQGPAKAAKAVVVAAAAAVQENVTPVQVGGASQQGINIKVKLPVKAKGKAKGKGTGGLKAKATAATKKAQSVKQEKPAPAPPPVKPLHKESVYDFNDSDDDGLVVDENPPPQPRRSYQRAVAVPATPALPPISTFSNNASMGNFAAAAAAAAAGTTSPVMESQDSKQGSLKLRLSFNGKPKVEKGPAANNKAASAPVVPKTAASGEDNADVPKNGTIDDLLLASSIALDTDSTRVSLEEELGGGRASPSTRDAIQGMLSMSKSAFTFGPCDGGGPMGPTAQELLEGGPLSTGLALGLAGPRGRIGPTPMLKRPTPFGSAASRMRSGEEEDLEESLLKECHADDDYVYPGLEASDDELRVFKPRGRSKRDEAWNPKAKLAPNCPKPPRPTREGTQKKSVKRTIEDTASKLANKPPPKRSYHRKKAQAPPKAKEKDMEEFEAGPSTSSAVSKKPSLPPDAFRLKKPKKGFATAKQRLGKILKIHKMIY